MTVLRTTRLTWLQPSWFVAEAVLIAAMLTLVAGCDEGAKPRPQQAVDDGGPGAQTDASPDGLLYPANASVPECKATPRIANGGGFDKPPASPQHGTLQTVDSHKLMIRSEEGTDVTLSWPGAPLERAFAEGETVEFAKDETWSSVRGPRGAAFTRDYRNYLPGRVVPIPGGPEMTLRAGCGVASQGCDKVTVTIYSDLIATLNGESLAIANGETRTLGPWQITNNGHSSSPGSGHATGSCFREPSNRSAASLLAPASALEALGADAGS